MFRAVQAARFITLPSPPFSSALPAEPEPVLIRNCQTHESVRNSTDQELSGIVCEIVKTTRIVQEMRNKKGLNLTI